MGPKGVAALFLLASLGYGTLAAGVRAERHSAPAPPSNVSLDDNVSLTDKVNEEETRRNRSVLSLEVLSMILALVIIWYHRMSTRKVALTQGVHRIRSEFVEFIRPALVNGDSPAGGYFQDGHCPPHPLGTMQAHFEPKRSVLYTGARDILPWSSVRLAGLNACVTALVWSLIFILKTYDNLTEYIASFDVSRHASSADGSFWELAIRFFSKLSLILKLAVAFFLLYFVKQRMKWFQTLKQSVWRSQRSLETVAFMSSGFLCGDDEVRRNARYSIHRWLNAAHFFNYSSVSASLARFNQEDLTRVNLLTHAEAELVTKVLADSMPLGWPAGSMLNRQHLIARDKQLNPDDIFQSYLMLPPKAEHDLPDMQYARDQAAVARDLCLWWVQVRLQTAIKEKLMDKDKLKKLLGALWQSRTFMDSVLTLCDERPPVLWVFLMRLMVDLWIALIPFHALDTMKSWNVLLVFGPMTFSFIFTFMFDSIFNLTRQMWSPFGAERDDLNMDAILVLTERTTFTNLSRDVGLDLPPRLSELWDRVKDIPDEKDKKDKVKEKDKDKDKEGQEEHDGKDKGKGGGG